MEALRAWLGQAVLSDLPAPRRWSYLFFSLALFVALGSQSFLTPVKSAVFLDVVGTEWEPLAKSLCLVILAPCLIFYSMAVSYVASPQLLVGIVCGVYTFLYLFLAVSLLLTPGEPRRWVAWTLYYATETKGVIVMPMVWSVIVEASTPTFAKKAFPLMFFVIQIGGIFGSLVAIQVDSLGGEVNLLLLQVLCFVFIVGFLWVACYYSNRAVEEDFPLTLAGHEREANRPEARPAADTGKRVEPRSPWKTGLDELYKGTEGLWLLVSRPYVFMSFWVSYAALMPRTILDYQNQVLAVASFTERSEEIAYFGQVNLYINIGTAVLTLLGTRPIVEYFGVGYCLLALPVAMLLGVACLCLDYTLAMSTVTLVLVCILAYGLNSPCKEMLYVRTSREIKYKAKAWSEMYGNQVMKLFGAQVNLWVNREEQACAGRCFHPWVTISLTALWVTLWFGVAAKVGMDHRRLEAEDEVIT